MRLHETTKVKGNFGDALNGWLWQKFIPEVFASDDDILFVGIGTILDNNLPKARRRVVFGSGAGYATPPKNLQADKQWKIYCVRGHLTARALELEPNLALTDPAILLAKLPEFSAHSGNDTLFIPHWKSVRYGRWQQVCAAAGVRYIDPCQDSLTVISAIANARKVIAESMHAAIIADALRVPWIPVALSREIAPFKWQDWATSVGVPYHPRCLPPSSAKEALRNALLKYSVFSNVDNYPSIASQRRGAVLHCEDIDSLLLQFETTATVIDNPWRWHSSIFLEMALKRVARERDPINTGLNGGKWFDGACQSLSQVAADDGFLSADTAHRSALQQTLDRLDTLRMDYQRGLI